MDDYGVRPVVAGVEALAVPASDQDMAEPAADGRKIGAGEVERGAGAADIDAAIA